MPKDGKEKKEPSDWETSLLKAFAHSTRRKIFSLIRNHDGDLSPREMAEALDHPLSNVSYHVRVLAEAEAIDCVSTQPVRGSMQHFYRVGPKIADIEWLASYLEGSE